MKIPRDISAGTMDVLRFAARKRFGASLRRSGAPALALALVLFSAILWDGPAQAGKRVALVIGNADYRASNWARLPNAVNDATDIAAALGRLGFAVTSLKNGGKEEMVRSLDAFSKTAAGAELALIFYAGHSIEVGKRNFLIPVDARVRRPGSVAREAVPLDRLLRAGSTAEGLRLVLLDACRDNPFAGRIVPGKAADAVGVGLGPPADMSGEILVGYAAMAGTQASDGVGLNSPYTAALLYYLEQPGLEVGQLLRFVRDAVVTASQGEQQPFRYASRSAKQVFFKPPLELASPPARLTGPASVEERLDLTQRQRQRIQVALWAQGFDPGLPTGRFDGPTREKIAEWQEYYGRNGTGFLDRQVADSLLAEVSDPSGPVWLKTADQSCTVWVARPLSGRESASWSGDCVSGKASGKGQLSFLRYFGTPFVTIKTFDGEMLDGVLTGTVIEKVEEGPGQANRYEGEFRYGRKHGRGTKTSLYSRYEGEFRDGKEHGRGVYTQSGYRYDGEWREGQRHGYGKLETWNNFTYEGEFREDKYHGHGKLTMSNGQSYEGEFREGIMHGKAMWTTPSGTHFDGEYRGGTEHGFGKITYADGRRYEGEWRDGKFHGRGTYAWPSGARYEGEWSEDKPHGTGAYRDSRNRLYQGNWREGCFGISDGRAIFLHTTAKACGFQNQKPKAPAADPVPAADSIAAEVALQLKRRDRVLVQLGLTAQGHSLGAADGKFDPATRRALLAWQRRAGRKATGYLTPAGLTTLKSVGEEAERKAQAELERLALEMPPGKSLKDCPECPEMVVVPAGSFIMGSPASEIGRRYSEGPQRRVAIRRPFAVGKYEVTRAQFARFVAATRYSKSNMCWTSEGGGRKERFDRGWSNPGYSQSDRHPVTCISWHDAKAYVGWLSRRTGKRYRLLSEAEWEYAARAGTQTRFHWGDDIGRDRANCDGCGSQGDDERTAPVGSFRPNRFDLHDMHGNVMEWVEDCFHENYRGAPSDDRPWTAGGDCAGRVLRGGSWNSAPRNLRAAVRGRSPTGFFRNRSNKIGFRVARTLTP